MDGDNGSKSSLYSSHCLFVRINPIVVYGTSIAQGGCASRPGLAWTNILGRKLDRPVINLAFSGNGKLEKELIELLSEIDASLYVLDCLPNLTSPEYYSTGELKKRIRYIGHRIAK